MINTDELVTDFVRVAGLAGVDIKQKDIQVTTLSAPHAPPTTLPSGKMAVYVFHWGEQCLKIGKVGPKSQPRYTSQHYSPNAANSTLAKSLLKHKGEMGLHDITDATVGNWIRQNADRVDFLMSMDFGMFLLSLLEAFLQCRLQPCFEGFDTQR